MVAAKKSSKFNPQTFLSTINGGRKIEAVPKKQTIFAQGDLSDAVFYIKKKYGSPLCQRSERKPSSVF